MMGMGEHLGEVYNTTLVKNAQARQQIDGCRILTMKVPALRTLRTARAA